MGACRAIVDYMYQDEKRDYENQFEVDLEPEFASTLDSAAMLKVLEAMDNEHIFVDVVRIAAFLDGV